MVRVLFVCLGNICRSATAEAVFKYKVKTSGLSAYISCDSAGTAGFHEGEFADSRMRIHAMRRGYKIDSVSRQINAKDDFENFDMIIGMDDSNIKNLKAIAPNSDKISKITDYCKNTNYDSVPDPYYGGDEGFELTIDILEEACDCLLQKIKDDIM